MKRKSKEYYKRIIWTNWQILTSKMNLRRQIAYANFSAEIWKRWLDTLKPSFEWIPKLRQIQSMDVFCACTFDGFSSCNTSLHWEAMTLLSLKWSTCKLRECPFCSWYRRSCSLSTNKGSYTSVEGEQGHLNSGNLMVKFGEFIQHVDQFASIEHVHYHFQNAKRHGYDVQCCIAHK